MLKLRNLQKCEHSIFSILFLFDHMFKSLNCLIGLNDSDNLVIFSEVEV